MQIQERRKLSHFFGLTIALYVFWILLSGKFETKFLLIGLMSSIIISYICLPLLVVKNPRTGKQFSLLSLNYFRLLLYVVWLIGQIFACSCGCAKLILKPHLDNEPRVVYFSMPYENPIATLLLANSITLTPGTITFDVSNDGVFEVHAISEKCARSVTDPDMAERIAKVFGETCEFVPLPQREVTDIPKER